MPDFSCRSLASRGRWTEDGRIERNGTPINCVAMGKGRLPIPERTRLIHILFQ